MQLNLPGTNGRLKILKLRIIRRSEAVQKVAKTIIENGQLALQAKKYLDEYGKGDQVELPMIGVTSK